MVSRSMRGTKARGTGILPFFCTADVDKDSDLDVSDGEMAGRVRSAGFMLVVQN